MITFSQIEKLPESEENNLKDTPNDVEYQIVEPSLALPEFLGERASHTGLASRGYS